MTDIIKDEIKKYIEENEEEMIQERRYLHENPELSMKEVETTKWLKKTA